MSLSEASHLLFDPTIFRPGHRVEILRDGEQTYPRMLEDILSARQTILLEMYVFASDLTGWKFARPLARQDDAGLQVRVMYDSLGSRDSTDEVFDFMLAHGIEVYEFAPTFPRRWSFFRKKRDHRKQLIVDGRAAYVGGINIANEYAPVAWGGGGWRDTMARIEGPAVADLRDLFLSTWNRGPLGHIPLRAAPPPAEVSGGVPVAVMGSMRWRDRRSIVRHYLHALSAARERIWITNAYFVPDRRFLRALRLACGRGVDVRIIVPARADAWPVTFATRALFSRLLKWGAKIFEWRGPMMHAKTAVIDGVWSLIGSLNLDHLSLFQNLELVMIAAGRSIGSQVESMFELDVRGCEEVTLASWRRRGILRRFVERACYSARFLM
jgi:cardiolipin synthase